MRLLALCALAVLGIVGCTAQQIQNGALTAETVIDGVVSIAQAELPTLPAEDSAKIAPWANLLATLDSQLHSCVSSAISGGSKSAAFGSCFNTFASGATNPSELAELRVTSISSQTKAQTWIAVVIVAVNSVLTAAKVVSIQTPQVASSPASASQIKEFAQRNFAGLDLAELRLADMN